MRGYCKCYFSSFDAAADGLSKLRDIVDTYGFVTVSDYYEICLVDNRGNYLDNRYGWTNDALNKATVCRSNSNRWFISLPRPIPIDNEQPNSSVGYKEYSKTPTRDTDPQPIYITIHTNEISDLNKTLAETFKYIYTIQGRTVNLTIM